MLKQQIIGVINLSLLLIILYQGYPTIFFLWYGKIACALAMGLYIYYLNKQNLIAMIKPLTFKPTDPWKKMLEQQIISCNLQIQNITLFYAYTNEALAIAAGNNIIIDPLVWDTISDDPEALKVQAIINPATNHSFSELQKIRIQKTREIFSHNAQSFIFKHELGHVARNYSSKKLFIVFLVGTLSTYIGIISAVFILPTNGLLAIFVGMFTGGLSDLILSYFFNATFKAYEERQADMFAIKYSSQEEIEAAATFFEKHQNILDTYPENHWLNKIPSIILSGHLNGKKRAALLRSHL